MNIILVLKSATGSAPMDKGMIYFDGFHYYRYPPSTARDKPPMLRRHCCHLTAFICRRIAYVGLSLKGRLRDYAARWAQFLRASPRPARDLATYSKGRNVDC